MTRRLSRLCSARPSRTRCPSPPETKPPFSPSSVCSPAGSFFKSSCNSADLRISDSGSVPGFAPKRRFSNSVRFQSWTAGSTQAVCSRRSFTISPFSGTPSIRIRPLAGRHQPKQTRFACTRWAHDRHMTSRRQFEIDLFQHKVTGETNADLLKNRTYSYEGRFREYLLLRESGRDDVALLRVQRSAQRLEQPQST